MSKKDYELIANVVAHVRLYDERDRWEVASTLSHAFAGNPKFNPAKFVAACTVTQRSTTPPDERPVPLGPRCEHDRSMTAYCPVCDHQGAQ